MKWENVFESIVAFPSILLDQIVTGAKNLIIQEEELIKNGEFDTEDPELDNS